MVSRLVEKLLVRQPGGSQRRRGRRFGRELRDQILPGILPERSDEGVAEGRRALHEPRGLGAVHGCGAHLRDEIESAWLPAGPPSSSIERSHASSAIRSARAPSYAAGSFA